MILQWFPKIKLFKVLNCGVLDWIASVCNKIIFNRDGIEDPTFEAKVKDSKKSEAKAKDRLFEDSHFRSRRQECSRPSPRTLRASDLKKTVIARFQAFLKKNKKNVIEQKTKIKVNFCLVIFLFH